MHASCLASNSLVATVARRERPGVYRRWLIQSSGKIFCIRRKSYHDVACAKSYYSLRTVNTVKMRTVHALVQHY